MSLLGLSLDFAASATMPRPIHLFMLAIVAIHAAALPFSGDTASPAFDGKVKPGDNEDEI